MRLTPTTFTPAAERDVFPFVVVSPEVYLEGYLSDAFGVRRRTGDSVSEIVMDMVAVVGRISVYSIPAVCFRQSATSHSHQCIHTYLGMS